MLPQYPDFKQLDLSHKDIFEEAFKKNPPQISEYTFSNLYSWRKHYNFSISQLKDFIILKSEYDRQIHFFPPISINGDNLKTQEITKIILKDFKAVFTRMPEDIKNILSNDDWFFIKPDPDYFDYVYKIKDLVELKGPNYDGKRNLIKKFKSVYEYKYFKITKAHKDECLDFQERWCREKKCAEVPGLEDEDQALREMLINFDNFNLTAAAVKIDSKIYGLAIAQPLNKNTLVMHILKAFPEMTGLYQFVVNEFLAKEAGAFEYVNFEEDMGIEGLRKAKLSYHPSFMVKKYTITSLR